MTYTQLYLLLFAVILVPGILAQISVQAALKKYSQVRARSGRTGAEAAAEILNDAGIHDVEIERTDSFLGDHYDPRTKTLALSPDVYDGESVAALGIAAHETGHAIQHQHAYAPLQARMAIVPPTMFTSQIHASGRHRRVLGSASPCSSTLGIAIYTLCWWCSNSSPSRCRV